MYGKLPETDVDGFLSAWKIDYINQAASAIDEFRDNTLAKESDALLDVLNESLNTIFGDVHLLKECVKNTYLAYYSQSEKSKNEVDSSMQDSMANSFAGVTSELLLAVENMSNKTIQMLSESESLLNKAMVNLQETLTDFNQTTEEKLNSLQAFQIPVEEMRSLAEMATSRYTPYLDGRFETDELFSSVLENVQLNSDITLQEAQNELSSKINEEKRKMLTIVQLCHLSYFSYIPI